MTWFDELMGFPELSTKHVQDNIKVVGNRMISKLNGRELIHGNLEIQSLGELRDAVETCHPKSGKLLVREIIADVKSLHTETSNQGSLFQVASQFNLLEMVSPTYSPEQGVGIYQDDLTQGPACAMSCGAGTIYRNYFAPVGSQIGQSLENQIDCIADLGTALGNTENRLWTMQNGYLLPSQASLTEISTRLSACSENDLDALRKLLKVGIQWQTQVTLENCKHTVSQAYCSALPVAYCSHMPELWKPFACLVLEAAYEATVCAAILNSKRNGNNRLFLTLLGGGAFGNEPDWIQHSMQRALERYRNFNLDVYIVSHKKSHETAQKIVSAFQN